MDARKRRIGYGIGGFTLFQQALITPASIKIEKNSSIATIKEGYYFIKGRFFKQKHPRESIAGFLEIADIHKFVVGVGAKN